jgi:hypothetical protein
MQPLRPNKFGKGDEMSLSEKLASISKDQTVAELGVMLEDASVSISWYGERLVSVKGLQGSVGINDLVAKYLNAAPKSSDGIHNLKARLDFYNLWTKVKRLCRDTSSLDNTYVYRFLVPTKEFIHRIRYTTARDYMTSRLKGSLFPAKNEWCFAFLPNDFKQLWPDEKPWESRCFLSDGRMVENHVATEEMVRAAYTRKRVELATSPSEKLSERSTGPLLKNVLVVSV